MNKSKEISPQSKPKFFRRSKVRALKNHTSHIKLLRKLLPLIGVILIVMILIWPAAKQLLEGAMEDFPKVSKDLILENKVINPRIVSTDNKGQPYEMRADSAFQVDKERTEMTQPKSSITTAQGSGVTIHSNKGVFDKNTNCMTYEDNVKLATSDGYKFSVQKVDVDVNEQKAQCNEPVSGDGPGGTIRAQDGVEFDKHADKMHFKGPTRLILNSK